MSAHVDVLAVLDNVPSIVESAANDLLTMHSTPGGRPHDPDPAIAAGLDKVREARAAVAAMIEVNRRVSAHLAGVIEFLEKQYPEARQLDRGPVMRNMRRWRDQLSTAIAKATGEAS